MMLCYNANTKQIQRLKAPHLPQDHEVCWLHFTEQTKEMLQDLLEKLSIHPLAKKALLNGSDFPKVDQYEKCAFVSIFIVNDQFQKTQLRIIATERYVISFTEREIELAKKLFVHLQHHPDHLSHPGYILYEFLNSAAMEYLELVDYIARHIQALEKQVFKTPFANEIGHLVFRWKVRLHELRQIAEAQEEVMKTIGHSNFPYVNEESNPYIQDAIARFARVTSALDTFRETLTGIFDLQLSLKSDHMNVIMKTLTLVSVVFIPMTFIAGLYGMNFEKMPELKWKYGYLYALLLMASLGIGIALYFKKKGWWGERSKHQK
ncbi:magnesium transporter [Anoxybacillus calidus]|jgi:magnesium transporter|uniref:Magnesium transport protein CorA n=1 Tax=[Anoxybacillus] calidus TaxID=575178 RepID=A0A7W0BVX6_9BACL|nr:magnesium/cobalt transporter CorA [Anoxybacillus calidus]MBA2870444.1 magnesium transporter [Anoxybacillus calidus]